MIEVDKIKMPPSLNEFLTGHLLLTVLVAILFLVYFLVLDRRTRKLKQQLNKSKNDVAYIFERQRLDTINRMENSEYDLYKIKEFMETTNPSYKDLAEKLDKGFQYTSPYRRSNGFHDTDYYIKKLKTDDD